MQLVQCTALFLRFGCAWWTSFNFKLLVSWLVESLYFSDGAYLCYMFIMLYIHRAPSGGGACRRKKTGEPAPHVPVRGAGRCPSTGDVVARQEGASPSREGVPCAAIRQPALATPSTRRQWLVSVCRSQPARQCPVTSCQLDSWRYVASNVFILTCI